MNYLAGPLTRVQIPMLNQLAGAGAAPVPQPVITTLTAQSSTPSPALDAFQPIPITPAVLPEPASRSTVNGLAAQAGSATRPSLPAGIKEYFLPNNLTLTQALKKSGHVPSADLSNLGLVYHPVILGQAKARFLTAPTTWMWMYLKP